MNLDDRPERKLRALETAVARHVDTDVRGLDEGFAAILHAAQSERERRLHADVARRGAETRIPAAQAEKHRPTITISLYWLALIPAFFTAVWLDLLPELATVVMGLTTMRHRITLPWRRSHTSLASDDGSALTDSGDSRIREPQ
ncbi:hypothetical protein [Streptomyces lavendofoliae]|uniref:hypothetical protein n=1 Tax=Streptomyces lavendofoliae TaxID=67314 RepID=UPI003D8B437C